MVDIDPRNDGLESWVALEQQYGRFPDCLTTVSGRGDGGTHQYVRRPPGRLTARRLGRGIDIKTSSGYAVMPPSTHPDTGCSYTTVDGPIPAPPDWFIELVTERPREPRRKRGSHSRASARARGPAFSAAHSWGDILTPHGWECLDPDPDEDGARWLHPAATSSWSATIRYGCLFVYSTNTPFEPTEPGNPRGYSKFRAWTMLNQHDQRGAGTPSGIRKTKR